MNTDTLLCRAKQVDNDEWIEGFFAYDFFKRPVIQNYQDRVLTKSEEINLHTLCRCTGLKDKNGKLIFEGDILKSARYELPFVVTYGEHKTWHHSDEYECGDLGFYADFGLDEGRTPRRDILFWLPISEIIGNKFDNPELLEEWK